ncbi:MAG: hypothetical protein JNK35_06755, partial [Phycisphaerae bacterium]|nr:hypothetical protein [Phycisphaerae bacterium]
MAWCLEDGHAMYCPSFQRYAHLFPALRTQVLCSPTHPRASRLPEAWVPAARGLALRLVRGANSVGIMPGRLMPRDRGRMDLPPTPGADPACRDGRSRFLLFSWRFGNPAGIVKHREAILRVVRPDESVIDDARAFASRLDPSRPWVGVHVRRTDYAGFANGDYFYAVERYHEEMRALEAGATARGLPKPVFVIFGDEPRRIEEFPGCDAVISGGSLIQDMARLSRMDLILGPVSTFNAYAAYAGGTVVHHFGTPATAHGLEWAYRGLPIVHTREDALAHLAARGVGASRRVTTAWRGAGE